MHNSPLIDYDVSLVMEPMTLAGTVVGVYLNKAFPNWLITILLVLLLSYTTYRTIKKVSQRGNPNTCRTSLKR